AVVVPNHSDLVKEGNPIQRQLCSGKDQFIQIYEVVSAGHDLRFRMREDFDLIAPANRADLKTGTIVGKMIGTVLIVEPDFDQKLQMVRVTKVGVANFGQIDLVPVMSIFNRGSVALIKVFDAIAERIYSGA